MSLSPGLSLPLIDGSPLVTNNALTAMTLMIALSDPREKDVMTALITRMLSMEEPK